MNTLQLERKVATILTENIAFNECFEEIGAFNEIIMKYWFGCNDGKTYPFELSVKIDKNWLDEDDKTPIVSIQFATTLVKNGRVVCLSNNILENENRKNALQDFYFHFESLVLAELENRGAFGYQRDSYDALFADYKWFAEGKALTSSGRTEYVPKVEFKKNSIWANEQAYKKATVIAENKNAKRYIHYFLANNRCNAIVKRFLEMVLHTDKEVRIIRETSFWNYTFVIRPDMFYMDAKTLSKIGKNVTYNHQDVDEAAQVARYVFDLFSEHAVVNLCLDEVTIKQLNEEFDAWEEDSTKIHKQVLEKIEKLNKECKENKEFDQYETRYHAFLDGLLDLHAKYENLYQQLGEAKYKKRAEKAKRLWLRYTN